MGPYACVQVSGLLLQEVHRYIEESHTGAAAQEYYLIIVGYIKQLFPESAAFVHHSIPLLGAVGNGNEGYTRACEILQGFDRIVDGYLRQEAGAGIENVNFVSHSVIL